MKEYKSVSSKELKSFYEKLPKSERENIDSYMEYRTARGLNSKSKKSDVWSGVIRIRICADKPLTKLTNKELIGLASKIKQSSYGDFSKNEALTNLKRFMKMHNCGYDLESIRLIKKPQREKSITRKDLPTKEEVEKLIKHEPKMFWKAFLITQYEGGLRSIETRSLKWDDIRFNVDDEITELNIFSTKTKEQRTVFVKEASFYLKKLRLEQENSGILGEYIFHSPKSIDEPVSRSLISMWMKRLSKRVLGKEVWPYLLRHSRGNELYQKSKKGLISKDIALKFMGHSKEMSKVYTHDESEEVKKMLKDQVYHIEDLPEEKKHALQKQIDFLNNKVSSLLEFEKEAIKIEERSSKITKAIIELAQVEDPELQKRLEKILVGLKK